MDELVAPTQVLQQCIVVPLVCAGSAEAGQSEPSSACTVKLNTNRIKSAPLQLLNHAAFAEHEKNRDSEIITRRAVAAEAPDVTLHVDPVIK